MEKLNPMVLCIFSNGIRRNWASIEDYDLIQFTVASTCFMWKDERVILQKTHHYKQKWRRELLPRGWHLALGKKERNTNQERGQERNTNTVPGSSVAEGNGVGSPEMKRRWFKAIKGMIDGENMGEFMRRWRVIDFRNQSEWKTSGEADRIGGSARVLWPGRGTGSVWRWKTTTACGGGGMGRLGYTPLQPPPSSSLPPHLPASAPASRLA